MKVDMLTGAAITGLALVAILGFAKSDLIATLQNQQHGQKPVLPVFEEQW